MSSVVVIQSYVPKYRVALFEEVCTLCKADGVEFQVVSGNAPPEMAARADQAGKHSWLSVVPSEKSKRVRLISENPAKSADLIIAALSVRDPITWKLLHPRRKKVILWGHGGAFVQNGNFPRAAAEAYLASRSDHIMTYSRTGKRILQSNGINSGKITAIGNSTDTAALAKAIELQQSQKLPPKHARAVFVGGLDASKRIPFILKAAARARLLEPSFKLAIYGRGDLQSVVEREAQERPEVEYLGVAGVTELAQEAYLSSAIWMPGRVGLIAVDAVAMGIPVHTTDHPYHAPEVDFLTEGVTLQLLPNDPSEFAKASLIAMQQPSKIQRSWAPSVGQVAARMHRVIIDTLS